MAIAPMDGRMGSLIQIVIQGLKMSQKRTSKQELRLRRRGGCLLASREDYGC
jgi:hypothetical protein